MVTPSVRLLLVRFITEPFFTHSLEQADPKEWRIQTNFKQTVNCHLENQLGLKLNAMRAMGKRSLLTACRGGKKDRS